MNHLRLRGESPHLSFSWSNTPLLCHWANSEELVIQGRLGAKVYWCVGLINHSMGRLHDSSLVASERHKVGQNRFFADEYNRVVIGDSHWSWVALPGKRRGKDRDAELGPCTQTTPMLTIFMDTQTHMHPSTVTSTHTPSRNWVLGGGASRGSKQASTRQLALDKKYFVAIPITTPPQKKHFFLGSQCRGKK